MSRLVTGIVELVTNDPALGDGSRLGLVTDAALVIDDGHVAWVGRAADAPAADERTDLGMVRVGGHRREQRVRLEVRGVRIAVQRIEMVPDPDAVDLECVGLSPGGAQVVGGRGLRVQLHPNLEPRHWGRLQIA